MRRRFRVRRRWVAAAALLPGLAAVPMTFTAPMVGAQDAEVRPAKMKAQERVVRIGGATRVRGRFPGAADKLVLVEFRRQGSENWSLARRDRTTGRGRFGERIRPRANGRWRGRLANPRVRETTEDEALGETTTSRRLDPATPARRVLVRSRTTASVATRNAVVGSGVRISGRVRPGGPSRRVEIRAGGRSMTVRTSSGGRFSKTWRPGRTGTHRVRVRAKANSRALGSGAGAGTVQAFRPAAASWYGPGFYGNRTACGQTLGTGTLGVAHKTMPCGTRVTLRYNGREVTVPVIDRGPYAHGREYDLTGATRSRLGFGSTGTVLSSR